jgi:hypothetical protein
VHRGSNFQTRKLNFLLSLVSLAVGVTTFFALDWFHTAMIMKAAANSGRSSCVVPDAVRHHAFQPNCTAIVHWGRDSYEFFTNSLGLRDEKVRQVPVAVSQPRLLILGDSFTEGKVAWRDSYVGRISEHFRQYDFLNGGCQSYSPSNYLNMARIVLALGVEIDAVIVFIDISDTQDEAAYYRDIDDSGAVARPERQVRPASGGSAFGSRIRRRLVWNNNALFVENLLRQHLLLTNSLLEFLYRGLVRRGYYPAVLQGNTVFDYERSAWTYRKVAEGEPFPIGYAPLGVDGGIAKERAKMALLWQELAKRGIPLSVVVYPWPAQVINDTSDSRQVRVWREWCGGRCKRFVSLFPAFLAVREACPKSEPGCWYLSQFTFGDVHYNSGGNALVANAVIESLEAVPAQQSRLRAQNLRADSLAASLAR